MIQNKFNVSVDLDPAAWGANYGFDANDPEIVEDMRKGMSLEIEAAVALFIERTGNRGGVTIETGLPGEIVQALRTANTSVERSTAEIHAAYERAEHSGDYSDADEMAADRRESLHDAFEALLSTFRQAYPDVFGDAL